MASTQSSPLNLSTQIIYTFTKVILITICGAILAKRQTLKPSTAQTVYSMAEHLYLPCLVFASFVSAFNAFDIQTWVPTILVTLAFVVLEVIFVFLIGKFFIHNGSLSKTLLGVWGNTLIDPLSLSFLVLLGDVLKQVAQTAYPLAVSGTSRAINYLLIYSITSSLLRRFISKIVLERMDEQYDRFNNADLQIGANNAPSTGSNQNRDSEKSFVIYMIMALAVVGIIISFIPPVKSILVDENSFVYRTLTETVTRCGYAAPALLLIQIGSVLFHLKSLQVAAEANGTVAMTVCKCIIFPLIAFFILQLVHSVGWVKDPIAILQLLISSAAPLPLNIATDGLVKKDGNVYPKLFLAQYSLSLVSMSAFSYWFLTAYM